MSLYQQHQAVGFVKSYCGQLQNALSTTEHSSPGELEQSLIFHAESLERRNHARIREINEYLESSAPGALNELVRRRSELETAYVTFLQTLEKDQRERRPRNVFSWEDVNAVVQEVIDSWQEKKESSKSRRCIDHLRRFCNTLDNHSAALEMLPTNNEYVSLFYGSLTIIIKASASYTNVMETLPQHLLEINLIVAAVRNEVWLFDTDKTKALMWRMYSRIFLFLIQIIEWYKQRWHQRLLKSLNEKLPEFFSQQLEDVRKISEHIRREVQFRANADVHMSRLYLETVSNQNHEILVRLQQLDARTREEPAYSYESFKETAELRNRTDLHNPSMRQQLLGSLWQNMTKKEIGAAAGQLLVQQAVNEGTLQTVSRLSEQHDGQEVRRMPSEDVSIREPTEMQQQSAAPLKNKGDIVMASRHLEDFWDRDKTQPFVDLSDGFVTPWIIASRLESWAISVDGGILYISEPFSVSEDTVLSRVAAQYAALARKAGLPVVSYFCQPNWEEPPPNRTRETIELVSLVYSMIRQLIELLPPMLGEEHAGFLQQTFDELQGRLTSWKQALRLLEQLLDSTDYPILIIVVNGLQKLDDRSRGSTEKGLAEMIQLFKTRDSSKLPKLKVLFTTSGESAALNAGLDAAETLLTSTPPRRGGRPSSGTEPLPLHF